MDRAGEPRSIKVFGHRGARGIYPENTMAGFRHLSDIGVDAVEFDVQNAANRIPVLAHDPYISSALTRDSTGAWIDDIPQLIRATPAETLAHLDVGTIRPGTAYATRFPDQARLTAEPIPTLAQFCEWATRHPAMLLNIEIKSDATRTDLYDPPEVIVSDVLNQLNSHGLGSRSIISSFDWRVIHACRSAAPDVTRGYLTVLQNHGTAMQPNVFDGSAWMDGATPEDHGNSLPQTIADLGGQVWCPYFEDLTEKDLHRAQSMGLRVNVWTVNEWADIHHMAQMGVDGIISDYPARVQNVLAALALT